METNPIVQVQQGRLRGICESNINGKRFLAFRGIPYAKPPTGPLRFKDPELPESWSDVKDATKFGNRCVQLDWTTRKILGSEDCLYLNVYTPSLNASPPRAVMVWIHGGGFIYGSGEDDLYGPDYLIESDIVLVTINYRVGVLGFLNVDDEVASGNQGLKDQVYALKWVQQNILKFGGDPDNVTIFGESAGSASVHYLTISPLAQGLFHKAILQSGVATNPWANVCGSKGIAQRLSAIVGNEVSDSEKLVEYLQTIDATALVAAEYQIPTTQERIQFIRPFGPSIDTHSKNPFLSVPLSEAVKAGVKVPCICGYTKDEGIILLAIAVTDLTDEKLNEINANPASLLVHPHVAQFFKEKSVTIDEIKKIYFGDEIISTKNIGKMMNLMSDLQFILGIHNVLKNQIQVSHVPVYLYKFEYQMEVSLWQKVFGTNFPGIAHGDELTCLFYPKLYQIFDGEEPPAPGSTDHLSIQRLTELWTTFAKTGNPTPKTSKINPVIWKPIDNPVEYNCLNIAGDLKMNIETNLWHRLKTSIKNDF